MAGTHPSRGSPAARPSKSRSSPRIAWIAAAAAAAAVAGLVALGGPGSGEPASGSAATRAVAARAVTLADGADAWVGRPTAAVDGRGAVYVAWTETRGDVTDVKLRRSDDGRAFSPPVTVNGVPGDASAHDQAPARVAVGPGGRVYVAWHRSRPAPGRRFPVSELRLARSTDGGRTFEPAIEVGGEASELEGDGEASRSFHDLTVAPDGTVHVAWIESDGTGRSEIRAARSTDGGRRFGRSVVVDGDACPCCRIALAAGPEGRVYVAWRTVLPDGARDIVVAGSVDGGATYGAPVRVHADGWRVDACPHAGPALALDGDARLHVAWYTGRDGRSGAYRTVSVRSAELAFGAPVPLLSRSGAPVSQVALAADGEEVRVAWEDRTGASDGGPAVLVDRVRRPERRAAGAVRPARPEDGGVPARLEGAHPTLAAGGGVWAFAWSASGSARVLALPAPPPPGPPRNGEAAGR